MSTPTTDNTTTNDAATSPLATVTTTTTTTSTSTSVSKVTIKAFSPAAPPKSLSKRMWTPEEDDLLIKVVEENNYKNWSNIAQQIPNRSNVECHHRFLSISKQKNLAHPIKEVTKEKKAIQKQKQPTTDVVDSEAQQTPKQVKPAKEPKTPKPPKDPKPTITNQAAKVPKEPKAPAQPKKPKEPKEPKEPKAPKAKEAMVNEPKAPKEPKVKESKAKEPKELKEPKEPKEPKVPKEPKAPKAPMTPKEPKELGEKEPKTPKEPKKPKEPKAKEPKSKEPKAKTPAAKPTTPKETKKAKEPKAKTPAIQQPSVQLPANVVPPVIKPVVSLNDNFTQIHLPPLPLPAPPQLKQLQAPPQLKQLQAPPTNVNEKKEKKDKKNSNKQPQQQATTEKKDKKKNNQKKELEDSDKQRKQPKKKEKKAQNEKQVEGAAGSSGGEKKEKDKKKKPKARFTPHVTIEEVQKGLAESKYFYGQLRVNPKRYNDAYITVEGVDNDAFCDGLKNRNRGFHTDIVVFQILPEEEWKNRSSGKEEDEQEESRRRKQKSTTHVTIIEDSEDSDLELAALKDSTDMGGDDEGTIVLQTSISKLSIKERDEAEGFGISSSDSSDEDEVIIRQDVNDESESSDESMDEDDFVIVPPTTTSVVNNADQVKKKAPLNVGTPSKKSNDKIECVKGLRQNLTKLQSIVDQANKKNQFITCKVVHILEVKHTKVHIGLISNDPTNSTFANFTPMDTCLPRCLVFKESIPEYRSNPDKYKTALVSVSYSNWKDSSILPIGSFHSLFGECGEIEPETKALLKEFNVDTNPFSKEVMECLPKINSSSQWKISDEDLKVRRDLRNEVIVSIDPDTAKDLDDALSCVHLPDGNFEVGVHIADVSHFVKPGTALDSCAQQRATTVYLVQKAIPMLPSLLSEELCSLNYGVERFAFSVIWTLSPEGKVLKEWFGKSVIKSASRLTYGIAQTIIDGKIKTSWGEGLLPNQIKPILGPDTPEHVAKVVDSVMSLREIAKSLRKARMDNGAFNIHPTKLAFQLDEKGNPISTKIYPIYESNHLVEEFMLLANMQVASRICKYFPENALLRRHPDPNPRKLDQFIKFCEQHDWQIDSTDVTSFGSSIKALRTKLADQPHVFAALQMMSIRSMRLAEYFCTGNEDEDQWHHYALNVDHYTHFTSPIRRYADIIVHRLLQLSIEVERRDSTGVGLGVPLVGMPSSDQVAMITKTCNEKKLNSRKAQERSDKVFLCVLLQNTLTITDAVILNGGPQFIAVMVPMFGYEQRIYLDDLKTDGQIISHSYDKDTDINSIVWPGTSKDSNVAEQYKQLQVVKVKITVDKSRFPIDTRCSLMHPLYDGVNN